MVQVGLGNHAAALQYLEAATDERPVGTSWACYLKGDPLWDDLRSDLRFTALLKKIGLDHIKV